MNKNSLFVSIAALVLSVAALVTCIFCPKGNDSKSIEEALMNKPEMVIDAIKKYEQTMRDKALEESQKLVQANIEEMNNDENTPFVGPRDAKVTVVEFFDYSCGYCHKLYPELKKVIEANPEVKFVFKPLTFLSQSSVEAAKGSLAADKQGKFIEMHNALMDVKGQLTAEKIRSVAQEQGLDMAKYDADVASAEVAQVLQKVSNLARTVQVNGVPVLFINGKMLQTLDGNEIQSVINSNK